jgi:DNA-binding NtrC family response regulator
MGDKELIFAASKSEQKPGNGKSGNGNGAGILEPPTDTLNGGENGDRSATPNSLKSLVQSVRCEAERNAIATALEKTGWNRKAAARLLKVSYRTLLYKIEQYHMSSAEAYPSTFPGSGFRGNGKRI